MTSSRIEKNCTINKAIIAENVDIGNNVELGVGEEVPNIVEPNIYSFGLVTIGENSYVPDNIRVGKNTAISGATKPDEYPNGCSASGETLIKAGDI